MLPFELLDEQLDLNQTNHYHLSILVNQDGLLFSILHSRLQKYLAVKGLELAPVATSEMKFEQISKVIEEETLLKQTYESVSLIHTDKRSTLLPAALFNPEHLKSYFEFNHPLEDLEELHFNHIRQADAYLVFPLNHEIANLYLQTWVNVRFYHQATPLAENPLQDDTSPDDRVQLLINADHFDILVNKGQELIYHNNFSYRSDDDLLYFILMVFDRLGLDQEHTLILFSGDIDQRSGRTDTFRKYFKRLAFRKLPDGYIYPPGMHKLQEHNFFHLLQIYN